MNHFDEHMLELYVLDAAEVRSQKGEIEKHLKQCAGCRETMKRSMEFYAHAETILETDSTIKQILPVVPMPRAGSLDAMFGVPQKQLTSSSSRSVVQSVVVLVRRYKVTVVFGAALLLVASIVLVDLTSSVKNLNPSYIHLNDGQSKLELYNSTHEKLWELPVQDAQSEKERQVTDGQNSMTILDVDGDGNNEVAVATALSLDPPGARHLLRVFQSDGSLSYAMSFPRKVIVYGKTRYDAQFVFSSIVAHTSGDKSDIIAGLENGRSPFVYTRISGKGVLEGEYWHFGQLKGYLKDLNSDGKEELILCGVNDIEYPERKVWGVIVVLDPTKIVGRTQSTATRGFGFEDSKAELFYIRIPETDVDSIMGSHTMVDRLISAREAVLRFTVRSAQGESPVDLEYVFTNQLGLLEIKDNQWFVNLHSKLKAQGRITSELAQPYYKGLSGKVRYWDGQEWKLVKTSLHPRE